MQCVKSAAYINLTGFLGTEESVFNLGFRALVIQIHNTGCTFFDIEAAPKSSQAHMRPGRQQGLLRLSFSRT